MQITKMADNNGSWNSCPGHVGEFTVTENNVDSLLSKISGLSEIFNPLILTHPPFEIQISHVLCQSWTEAKNSILMTFGWIHITKDMEMKTVKSKMSGLYIFKGKYYK